MAGEQHVGGRRVQWNAQGAAIDQQRAWAPRAAPAPSSRRLAWSAMVGPGCVLREQGRRAKEADAGGRPCQVLRAEGDCRSMGLNAGQEPLGSRLWWLQTTHRRATLR